MTDVIISSDNDESFSEVAPYNFRITNSPTSLYDNGLIVEENNDNERDNNNIIYSDDIEEDPVIIDSVIKEQSNDSTTEELDTFPGDSPGTTDAGNYRGNSEAIGFGEGCVTFTHLQENVIVSSPRFGPHSYENWSAILNFDKEQEDLCSKRKRNLTKLKGMRGGIRQRPPAPLPRPSMKIKSLARPPAPFPRKRRAFGKTRPLQGMTTSEGDMEQADEMGDEGEGQSDDGFVEGSEVGSGRRRTKKRQQGVAPTLSNTVSPPSSPSNTPQNRRRTNSRRGRTKPRLKRTTKPVQASADISTQETTTPGPASSETDEGELIEEAEPVVADSSSSIPIHKLVVEEEEDEEMSRIVRTTPTVTTRTTPTSTTRTTPISRPLQANNNGNRIAKPVGVKKPLGDTKPSSSSKKEPNNGLQTSDTDLTSALAKKVSKIESDLSTAPETSDMSGSEVKAAAKKISPPSSSGIPRPVESPVLQRRVGGSTVRGTARTGGGAKAGAFVSKRSSVAAMISQFDNNGPTESGKVNTAAAKVPLSPRSPIDKTKPHPPVKPALSGKPSLKPKPASPKQTTPPKTLSNEEPSESVKAKQSENSKITNNFKPKPVHTILSPVSSKPKSSTHGTSDTSGESSSSSPSLATSNDSKATDRTNEELKGIKKSAATETTVKRTMSVANNKTTPPSNGKTTPTSNGKTKPASNGKTTSASNGKTTPTSSGKVTPTSNSKTLTTNKQTKTSSQSVVSNDDTDGDPDKKTTPAATHTTSEESKNASSPSSIKKTPPTVNNKVVYSLVKKTSSADNKTTPTTFGKATPPVRKLPEKPKTDRSADKVPTPNEIITPPVTPSIETRKLAPTIVIKSPDKTTPSTNKATPTSVKTSSTSISSDESSPNLMEKSEVIQKKLSPAVMDSLRSTRRSSPRRPPPEPPSSPPPISPTKSIRQEQKKIKDEPRNYEEFVPTSLRSNSRSNSLTTPPLITPPPFEDPTSHYEGVDIGFHKNSSDNETPPPLPPRKYTFDDPVISLPTSLSTVEERPLSPPCVSIKAIGSEGDVPPPLPTQPIPKKKAPLTHVVSSPNFSPNFSPLLRRKEIPAALIKASPPLPVRQKCNVYEEINVDLMRPRSNSCNSNSSLNRRVRQNYEVSENFVMNRPTGGAGYVKLTPSDSEENADERRFSASICVTNTSGLSPVSIRRANSDRFKNNRLAKPVNPSDSMQRTSSMDILDDRMNPSTSAAHNSLTDPGYSSGEEGSISPNIGLPQPPRSNFTMPSRRSPTKMDPDEEPLYQYINHADFTTTPLMSHADKCKTAPSAMLTSQLDIAKQLSFNHRKLWSEQPQVIESGVLNIISDQDRKLQEAMFEVLTSEASYLRSLNVLVEHFMEDPGMNPNLPEGRRVLDKRQHHVIFSNVKEVQLISSQFLKELQKRQRESAISQNICDIVLKYAENEFSCYIPYCTNQVYQMRELTDLLENNVMFNDYLKRLEKHKRCQNLTMTSFLLLPMQRITRLPLLILAIMNRTPMDNPNYPLVEKTLRTVQKLVTACNDGARQMERTEELHLIHQQLDFNKMKPFPLVSICRQLERKGPLVLLQVEQRLFGKPRIKRTPVFVFAFTDYIVVTKKKINAKTNTVTYRVIDYASKAVIEVINELRVLSNVNFPKHIFGEQETVAKATWAVSIAEEKNSFLLIFLENSAQKSEKYILVCQNETDRTRWLEALNHPAKEKQKEDEKIYESWDCPQVQAVFDYNSQQPDELSLMRGDVVKVYRKMADGWYEGERLRDLQWGWFPSNFTVEIENAHTRARNLKERHRLLSLPFNTEEFLHQFNASNN